MKHTIWTSPHLPDIEFLKGSYTGCAYRPHFHEEYVISFVEKGQHVFRYRGEHHRVPAGSVVIGQPVEVRAGCREIETQCHYRTLFLRPSILQQVAADLGHSSTQIPHFNAGQTTHPCVVYKMQHLHQGAELDVPALALTELLEELLTDLLYHFSDCHPQLHDITDERRPVECARTYINESYVQDIRLDDLAAIACLSKSYFIRAFRHHTGLSPYAYLIQVRLNRAKDMLRAGQRPAQVAQRVGFHDQSHLNRYFKYFLSLTPKQYQLAAIG